MPFTESTSESQGDSSSSSSSAPTGGRAPTNEVRRSETLSVYISLCFSPSVKPCMQRMHSDSTAEEKLRSERYSNISSHPATSWYFLYIATSSCLLSTRRWLCTTADTITSQYPTRVWVTFSETLQYAAVPWYTEFRSPALQPTAPEFGIDYHFPLHRRYRRNTIQNIRTLTSLKSPRNNAPFAVLPAKIFLARQSSPCTFPEAKHLSTAMQKYSRGSQHTHSPQTHKSHFYLRIQISSLPDKRKAQSQWIPGQIRLPSLLCFKLLH